MKKVLIYFVDFNIETGINCIDSSSFRKDAGPPEAEYIRPPLASFIV
ncbi:MAG: hypothetical protein V1897_14430 [Pseudomonadota bacterium]